MYILKKNARIQLRIFNDSGSDLYMGPTVQKITFLNPEAQQLISRLNSVHKTDFRRIVHVNIKYLDD